MTDLPARLQTKNDSREAKKEMNKKTKSNSFRKVEYKLASMKR